MTRPSVHLTQSVTGVEPAVGSGLDRTAGPQRYTAATEVEQQTITTTQEQSKQK